MEKATFKQATAKLQREFLFDEIQELKDHYKESKRKNMVAAFSGGFTAVFAACGGYSIIQYLKLKFGG